MTFEPIILGLKYAIRHEDLTPQDVLEVSCLHYNHAFLAGPHRLHERYGDFMRLIEIDKDLHCMRCDSRAVDWTVVRPVAPK